MADQQTSTALAPLAAADIEQGVATPVPTFSGPQMAQAFTAYRALQAALDHAMPDQIQKIGDKDFRKKGYWRAVAVAFNLTVEPVEERREVAGVFHDGTDNFGYLVTYRATARGGRSVTGDGTAFAVEKAEKFRCPHPEKEGSRRSLHYPHETCPDYDEGYRWGTMPAQATEHNVRAHAHTRAFNRAVSNLVGFGEVSAEEMERDDRDDSPTSSRPPRSAGSGSTSSTARISDPQRKRMFAIAKGHGWTDEEIKNLLKKHGFEHSDEVTRSKYEQICTELEAGSEPS
jgi:hypothetical protein